MIILSGIGISLLLIAKNIYAESRISSLRFVARLKAESGIEHAKVVIIEHLKKTLVTHRTSYFYNSQYPFFIGEDVNNNGVLDEGEDINQNGLLDTSNLELSQNTLNYATHKREFVENNLVAGYAFKIIDESGKIYINQDNLSIKFLLDNLENNILETYPNLSIPISLSELVDKKGEMGFTQIEELEKILGKSMWNFLSQFITIYGYTDNKVIEPKIPIFERKNYNKLLGYKNLGASLRKTNILTKRAPVNINTATLPVIVAILTNISSSFLRPVVPQFNSPASKEEYRNLKFSEKDIRFTINRVTINNARGKFIAQYLFNIISQKPVITLNQLKEHIYQLQDISDIEKDLIFTNANPNTDLIKLNPDWLTFPVQIHNQPQLFYKYMDKTDLQNYTTEFSFYPNGYFTFESFGYVRKNDTILSSATLTVTYKFLDIYKETTADDFAAGISVDIKSVSGIWGKAVEIYPIPWQFKPTKVEIDGLIGPSLQKEVNKEDVSIGVNYYEKLEPYLAKGKKNTYIETIDSEVNNTALTFLKEDDKKPLLIPEGLFIDVGNSIMYEMENNFIEGTIDLSQTINNIRAELEKYRGFFPRVIRIPQGGSGNFEYIEMPPDPREEILSILRFLIPDYKIPYLKGCIRMKWKPYINPFIQSSRTLFSIYTKQNDVKNNENSIYSLFHIVTIPQGKLSQYLHIFFGSPENKYFSYKTLPLNQQKSVCPSVKNELESNMWHDMNICINTIGDPEQVKETFEDMLLKSYRKYSLQIGDSYYQRSHNDSNQNNQNTFIKPFAMVFLSEFIKKIRQKISNVVSVYINGQEVPTIYMPIGVENFFATLIDAEKVDKEDSDFALLLNPIQIAPQFQDSEKVNKLTVSSPVNKKEWNFPLWSTVSYFAINRNIPQKNELGIEKLHSFYISEKAIFQKSIKPDKYKSKLIASNINVLHTNYGHDYSDNFQIEFIINNKIISTNIVNNNFISNLNTDGDNLTYEIVFKPVNLCPITTVPYIDDIGFYFLHEPLLLMISEK